MKNRGKRRILAGTVVSNKMDKTAVILVERLVKHRRYHKYIKRRATFAAHDKDNACGIGDRVLISETRPISRTKRWRVSEIVRKAA